MQTGSVALLAALLLFVGAPPAVAQKPAPARPAPSPSRPVPPPRPVPPGQPVTRTVPPPPSPLPQMPAALTVPNPFSGLIPGRRDLYQEFDRFPRPGFDHFPRPRFDRFPRTRLDRFEPRDRFQRLPRRRTSDFIGSGYWPYFPDPYYTDPYLMPSLDDYARREPVVEEIRGSLSLLTTPPSAQVFVDGFYVGLAGDFGFTGWPMSIDAGAHRVDLRAPGYETLSFNVMIEPNEILRYRGDMLLLQRTAAPATAPAASAPSQPRAPKRYYVIPNCYAGDRPPRGALPRGCDRKNMQTINQ